MYWDEVRYKMNSGNLKQIFMSRNSNLSSIFAGYTSWIRYFDFSTTKYLSWHIAFYPSVDQNEKINVDQQKKKYVWNFKISFLQF